MHWTNRPNRRDHYAVKPEEALQFPLFCLIRLLSFCALLHRVSHVLAVYSFVCILYCQFLITHALETKLIHYIKSISITYSLPKTPTHSASLFNYAKWLYRSHRVDFISISHIHCIIIIIESIGHVWIIQSRHNAFTLQLQPQIFPRLYSTHV